MVTEKEAFYIFRIITCKILKKQNYFNNLLDYYTKAVYNSDGCMDFITKC